MPALSATVTTFCLDVATPTKPAAHVGTLTQTQTHTHRHAWIDVSRKRKRQPNAIMKIHLICVYDFARRPLKRLKFNLPRKGDAEEVATGRRVNSQHFATATATCG